MSKLSNNKIRWDAVFLVVLSIFVFGGLGYLFRDKITPFFKDVGTKVRVTLKEEVRDYLEEDGGRIEVGDVDLEFAKKSFISPVEISVSEIGSIAEMPEGMTFVDGVDITADDKSLVGSVVAIFENTDGLVAGEVTGFTYDGEGENFHLYPINIKSDSIQMEIYHFSAYGLVEISPGFQLPEEPSDLGKKAEQLIAYVQIDIRENQIDHIIYGGRENNEENYKRIENILHVWYETQVIKMIKSAQTNVDMILPAGFELKTWWKLASLLSEKFSDDYQAAMTLLQKAAENGVQKSFDKCVNQKDPNQVSVMLSILLVDQYFDGSINRWDIQKSVNEKIRKCAKFELSVSGEVIDPGENGCVDGKEEYTGIISLDVDIDKGFMSGEGEVIGKVEYCGQPCSVTQGTLTQKISIPKTRFKSSSSNKPEVRMMLELPDNTADVTVDCSYEYDGMEVGLVGTNGHGFLYLFDSGIEKDGNILLKMDGWMIENKEGVYASKEIQNSYFGADQKILLELIHKPEK